jgi:flagellar hook-associated protein 1
MSISNLLNIGRHALGAYQGAIQQTSQNAANVGTPGYSRRRGTLSSLGQGTRPAGVQYSDPRRVVDRLSNASVRRARADAGMHRGREAALTTVETIVAPGENGLSGRLDQLFNSFQRLASKPGGSAERRAVVHAADSLVADLQSARAQLDQLQQPLTGLAQDQIQTVNRLSEQVAQLNGSIREQEASGNEASDLRDERDRLLDELSGQAGTRIVENKDGTVTVSLRSGQALVSSDSHYNLGTREVDGELRLTLSDDDGSPELLLAANAAGGELAGVLLARNEDVGGSIRELDEIAYGLAQGLNELHRGGFGLDGSTGRDFFVVGDVDGAAASIQVNSEVRDDPSLIAATRHADRLPGGSDLTLEMASLRETPLDDLGGKTIEERLSDLQVGVGQNLAAVRDDLSAAENQEATFSSIRESTRGVNLDEEMTDLIQFQRGFQAAGRVVRAADEMMEEVLALI